MILDSAKEFNPKTKKNQHAAGPSLHGPPAARGTSLQNPLLFFSRQSQNKPGDH